MKEAYKSARARGHLLSPFECIKPGLRSIWTAKCDKCGKQAQVITNPRPNEIDISGGAVVLNCK
jgi:hypothetical protein